MEGESNWLRRRSCEVGVICCGLVLLSCNRPADTKQPATHSGPPADSRAADSAAEDSPAAAPAAKMADRVNDHLPDKPLQAAAADRPATDREQPATRASPPSSATKISKASKQAEHPREPLFVDWPKPRFVLLMTGQMMGYVEPCGCTGLVNQKGGLARRHTLAKELEARGWPVIPVDVGNQVHRFGRQAEIKFQVTADALKKIGYRAIALGADDLRLSVGELAAQTLASDGQQTPFLSANASVLDASLTPTIQIIDLAGKKVGVTSVISAEWQKKIIGSEILLRSPEEGLDEAVPKLLAAKCDLLVLLAHATIDESRQLAEKYREFQVVVTAGGVGEPTFQPEPIPNTKSILVQVGLKGMFVGVLGIYDDPQTPWRYQRVSLDARFEDSREMLALLSAYQEQLKAIGLEGMGLKSVLHPTGHQFVGSEKCGECHTKAFAKWEESGHSHATDSLVRPAERSDIARHFDPECLSCHVTGWNPQQFFPYESGYLRLDQTPSMNGSGCENCHGPGSAHVAAEEAVGDPANELLRSLREAMRLPLAQAERKCQECHDLDNSPDFHATGAFPEYWRKVEHKGMD